MCSCCNVTIDVRYLFLAVPWVGLWSVIMALTDLTNLRPDNPVS